jgi:hypothetical protein
VIDFKDKSGTLYNIMATDPREFFEAALQERAEGLDR